MNTLDLRDPAFLGGPVAGSLLPAPIDGTDANTVGWWKATDHITFPTYIGDKMNTTVDKASSANPNWNLVPYNAAAVFCPTTSHNNVNLFYHSEDITASALWQVSNATKDSATTLTFTAPNGYLRQICRCADESAAVYVYRAKIRNISGNTGLRVRHAGSATGASTGITIDGVLTEYKITFLGPTVSGGTIDVGLTDINGAGQGQIEIQEQQIYRQDTGDDYIATTTTPICGNRGGIKTWSSGNQLDTTNWLAWNNPTGRVPGGGTPYSATVYSAVWIRSFSASGYGFRSINPNFFPIIGWEATALHKHRQYNGGWVLGDQLPVSTWCILTNVFNGASSEVRYNKNAANIVSSGTISATEWRFGGEAAGTYSRADFHECIIRNVVDNTATQDSFIEYLASHVGLTV
jgi:hypothetical protein